MPVFFCTLLLVAEVDVVAGRAEGVPRDVEPAGAGEELVSKGVRLQERDQALKLLGVAGTDIGCASLKVL